MLHRTKKILMLCNPALVSKRLIFDTTYLRMDKFEDRRTRLRTLLKDNQISKETIQNRLTYQSPYDYKVTEISNLIHLCETEEDMAALQLIVRRFLKEKSHQKYQDGILLNFASLCFVRNDLHNAVILDQSLKVMEFGKLVYLQLLYNNGQFDKVVEKCDSELTHFVNFNILQKASLFKIGTKDALAKSLVTSKLSNFRASLITCLMAERFEEFGIALDFLDQLHKMGETNPRYVNLRLLTLLDCDRTREAVTFLRKFTSLALGVQEPVEISSEIWALLQAKDCASYEKVFLPKVQNGTLKIINKTVEELVFEPISRKEANATSHQIWQKQTRNYLDI